MLNRPSEKRSRKVKGVSVPVPERVAPFPLLHAPWSCASHSVGLAIAPLQAGHPRLCTGNRSGGAYTVDMPLGSALFLFRRTNIVKLHVTALALTAGLLWSGAILVVGLANIVWPDYGRAFLDLTASIYPGYHPGSGIASVIMATLYGLVDGAIGGAIFAWLYNLLVPRRPGGTE